MANFFRFKGISNVQMGVVVTELPNAPTPTERGEAVEIPGRSGTIWRSENAYEDIALSPTVWVPPDRVGNLTNIKAWLMGQGELTLAPGAPYYYRARRVTGLEFTPMHFGAGYMAVVPFVCYPFAYLYNVPRFNLASSGNIHNPYNVFSEPLFEIRGSGDVEITMGSTTFELHGLSTGVSRFVDCEAQECYTEEGLLNHKMAGAFPVLAPGGNDVSWEGTLTMFRVSPRWRML